MKKKMNIIFFGICFLASLIAEAYCIQILDGDLFSTLGIGAVVLLMGYLFMDTIRSEIKLRTDNFQFYTDRILREETEKWSERYSEITKIQKATYSVTKKNEAMLNGQIGDILTRLDRIDNNSSNELHMLVELQKKSLEGQKNALNMQIHYNKENTKQIIQVLKEEGSKNDISDQLSKVLDLMESNNELLKVELDNIEKSIVNINLGVGVKQISAEEEYDYSVKGAPEEDYTGAFDTDNYLGNGDYKEETATDMNENLQEDILSEAAITLEDADVRLHDEAEIESAEDSDYRTPEDEVLQSAGYSNVMLPEEEELHATGFSNVKLPEDEEIQVAGYNNVKLQEDEELQLTVINNEQVTEDEVILKNGDTDIRMSENESILPIEDEGFKLSEETKLSAEEFTDTNNIDQLIDESDVLLTDEADQYLKEDGATSAEGIGDQHTDVNPSSEEADNTNNISVTPLYNDPNKALSADEIAALFASFGN